MRSLSQYGSFKCMLLISEKMATVMDENPNRELHERLISCYAHRNKKSVDMYKSLCIQRPGSIFRFGDETIAIISSKL